MKFSEFTLICDNDERLKIYKKYILVATGYTSDFLTDSKFDNCNVNKFFSYDDNDGHGSYIEVHIK